MTATVKKTSIEGAPRDRMGALSLVSGTQVSLRMWDAEEPREDKTPRAREYETVGYALEGRARLRIEEHEVVIEPGDSWLVPAGALHTYEILEPFTALEATAPPAQMAGRDAPVG
jgi:mannose-6-phosphate isomerase-like protein (cupin superfamily)